MIHVLLKHHSFLAIHGLCTGFDNYSLELIGHGGGYMEKIRLFDNKAC